MKNKLYLLIILISISFIQSTCPKHWGMIIQQRFPYDSNRDGYFFEINVNDLNNVFISQIKFIGKNYSDRFGGKIIQKNGDDLICGLGKNLVVYDLNNFNKHACLRK